MTRYPRPGIGIALAVLSLLAGCARESEQNPEPLIEFLEAFEAAWEARDIGEYGELLAPNEFTFHFDDDVDAPPRADTWSYEDELDAVGGLFAEARHVELELDQQWDFVEYHPDADELSVYEIGYELVIDYGDGERVADGGFNLRLVRRDDGDEERWLLAEWWDVVPYEIGGTTWGTFKLEHTEGHVASTP
ncbi:MAG: hypothetical protein GF403_03915 [Candidatus Coatesbacteria bacterium]|nr:hypothetical protein [Candidatus Coatesbacteria bacterium]